MKKKLLAGLIVCSMLFSVGCGSLTSGGQNSALKEDGTETESGTVLNVGIGATITDVSPFGVPNQAEIPIQSTIYQRLFTTSGLSSEETIPVIGKSWEMVDDCTVEVKIYDNVRDSSGNQFTAEDAVFSFETAKTAANDPDVTHIDTVTAIDDYTFQLKLAEPNDARIVKLLTYINMVTKTAYEENQETPAATAPYKITSYTAGSTYECEKVEDYWQTDSGLNAYDQQANVDRIIFNCIPEAAQVTTALETGEIQMAISMDGKEAARFGEGGENQEGYLVDTYAGMFSNVLLFNDTEASPCKDENLRKAICYAIDRNSIINTILNGAGLEAKDMASSVLIGFDVAWNEEDYYSYNKDKAEEYLKQSNYNGETLKLQSDSSNDNLLELLQAQLAAVGIKTEIATYENALWQQLKVAGTGDSEWDISIDGLGGSRVESAWNVKFNPQNFVTGLPQTGTTDEEVVELLNAALSEPSKDNLNAFHDYVTERAYAIGVYSSATKCVTVDSIKEIVYSYMGTVVPGSCKFENYNVR